MTNVCHLKKNIKTQKQQKKQFLGHMGHPLTPYATTPAAAATLTIFTHIVWRDEHCFLFFLYFNIFLR